MKRLPLIQALVLLGLLVPSLSALAEHDPTVPEDFAYGLNIDAPGKGAVYELELPGEVYGSVTRSDLGDMRIFNGSNEIVPFALRPPAVMQVRREDRYLTLPFFPVPRGDGGTENISVRVDAKRDGAIVEVSTTGTESPAAGTQYWIVDATALRTPLASLDFSWQPAVEPFIERLDVSVSDDLSSWRRVGSAVMASLEFEGRKLVRSSVTIDVEKPRYLQLAFRKPAAVRLASLQARTRTAIAVGRSPMQWQRLTYRANQENPGEYLYDAGAFLPVEKVRIAPPSHNRLVTAGLYSSLEKDVGRRREWQGMIYDLRMGGERIALADITLPRHVRRFWTIVPDESEAGLGGAPVLEVGWRPDRLLFMAAGDGPYRLAMGSAAVLPSSFDLENLLAQQSRPGRKAITPLPAAAGTIYPLGGEERLQPPPPPAPWQKIVLWCVLVLSVALIGGMALSLLRQLKDQEDKSGREEP